MDEEEEFAQMFLASIERDVGRYDLLNMHDGTLLTTHGPDVCMGPHCCIHNPSEHPLRDAPLVWLDNARAMYRRCEHGAIHPDPDSFDFVRVMALLGRRDMVPDWHPCCEQHCCQDEPVPTNDRWHAS